MAYKVGAGGHRLMKRGVENRDMRDFGKLLHRSMDSDQVGRVMQGSEFAAVFDSLNHFLINSHAVLERFPAVHHPVADSDNFQAAHLMKDLFKHFDMPAFGSVTSWLVPSANFVLSLASGELKRSARPWICASPCAGSMIENFNDELPQLMTRMKDMDECA